MMRSIPRISISLLALATLVLATEGCGPELFVKHRPAAGAKPRVAVLRFQDAPGQTGSGSVATDVFSAQLLSVDAYDVIDRGAIDKVIEEQKLGASGLIRPGEAAELGKLVGADAVILGSVTEYRPRRLLMFPPAKVALAVRAIDTRTGQVDWSAQQRVGGPGRWLTWVIPVIGAVATAFSPSAEDLLAAASRRICRSLRKNLAP